VVAHWSEGPSQQGNAGSWQGKSVAVFAVSFTGCTV